jgi:AcrR family transcriptional regulator
VYSHFQDKESLFIALIQRLAEQKFQSFFGAADAQALQMGPQVVLRSFADEPWVWRQRSYSASILCG